MENIFKKIMLIIVGSLCLLSGVNALSTTNNGAWWGYDNLTDDSGNGRTLTNNGANYTASGLLNGAYSFDGINDEMNNNNPVNSGTYFTIATWIYLNEEADVNQKYIIMSRDPSVSSNANYYLYLSTTNDYLTLGYNDGGWQNCQDTATDLSASTWYHVVATFNTTSNEVKLYRDGTLVKTCSGLTGTPITGGSQNQYIGSDRGIVNFFDGILDEPNIWTRDLSLAEIQEEYNSGNGFNPYISSTPTINHNLTDFYSSENISVALNTSTNTNMSYYLDGGSEVSICSDCNSTILNLNSLSEGSHSILFGSVDENGQVNSSANFTIDTTNPVINNSIPTEINDYEFNGSWFSCTDTNLDSCNISIDGFNKASGVNFTLTNNGNLSYNITAVDLAGNTVTETGVLFVNPYQYFYFTYTNGTAITNFDFGGRTFTDYANILTYGEEISLGSNNLSFEKVGFATTPIIFNVNTTSQINLTTNITESTIVLRIFNGDDDTILTGLTSITLISSTGYNATTTTGYLNITDINFIAEDYQIIAEHDGYTTETIYFTYDNQKILEKDIFLINATGTDYGYVTMEVTANTGQLIQGAICRAKEWDTTESAYKSVAEGLTNTNGRTNLNIHLNVDQYKFECNKDGASAETQGQIIQTTGTVIPLELSSVITVPVNVFGSVTYTYTNTTLNATHQLLTFDFTETDNLLTQACINTYKQVGTKKTFIAQNCTSSATGTLYKVVDINNTYTLITIASMTLQGISENLESITFKGNGDISYSLAEYHLDILVPLLFIIIGIIIGLALKPQNIYISVISSMFMVWFSVAVVPTVISSSIALFVTFIGLLMLYGGQRK